MSTIGYCELEVLEGNLYYCKEAGGSYAPAVVGFEFKNGRSYPIYDAYVEFKNALLEVFLSIFDFLVCDCDLGILKSLFFNSSSIFVYNDRCCSHIFHLL